MTCLIIDDQMDARRVLELFCEHTGWFTQVLSMENAIEGYNYLTKHSVDIVFLGVDVLAERLVITLFRENVSIENGVLIHADVSIPLSKFSADEFKKALDRLIPAGDPFREGTRGRTQF